MWIQCSCEYYYYYYYYYTSRLVIVTDAPISRKSRLVTITQLSIHWNVRKSVWWPDVLLDINQLGLGKDAGIWQPFQWKFNSVPPYSVPQLWKCCTAYWNWSMYWKCTGISLMYWKSSTVISILQCKMESLRTIEVYMVLNCGISVAVSNVDVVFT